MPKTKKITHSMFHAIVTVDQLSDNQSQAHDDINNLEIRLDKEVTSLIRAALRYRKAGTLPADDNYEAEAQYVRAKERLLHAAMRLGYTARTKKLKLMRG